MIWNRRTVALSVAAFAAFAFFRPVATQPLAAPHAFRAPQQTAPGSLDDPALSSAICSIVYQVDRSPSPRGYHYLFYGNGFFINQDGYLLTAAHVLGPLHGGQPYLLLRPPSGPPRFLQAVVVALDRDHDVAILRATPNPFAGNFGVSFLPLAHQIPLPGRPVFVAARRPSRPRDSYTLDPFLEERPSGEALNLEFSELEKGRADTELFLFSHSVQPGQSGGPVVSLDTHEVLGFVEGQWLRADTTAAALPSAHSPASPRASSQATDAAPIPGAVVPIHYAIVLLQQKGISWHGASETSRVSAPAAGESNLSSPPTPFSLVPAPYPSQSLFGGEVLLDALVGRNGLLSDVRVVSGGQPFLDNVLAAVHTWTFYPARSAGRIVDARIAIVFQFPQPYLPPRSSTLHVYDQPPFAAADNRAARPLKSVEPSYPPSTDSDGSVILYESIDSNGNLASGQVVQDLQPFTPAVLAASRDWTFTPARQSGNPVDSAAVIAVTFRRPLAAGRASR